MGKSHIFIIFFDVSNNQSFLDVARVWLQLAKKVSGGVSGMNGSGKKGECNVVLMANKIDRQPIVNMKSLY